MMQKRFKKKEVDPFKRVFPTRRLKIANGETFTIRRLTDWRLMKVAEALLPQTYGFAWEQIVTVKIPPKTIIYLAYISRPEAEQTVQKLFKRFKQNWKKAVDSASSIIYEKTETVETVEGTILHKTKLCTFTLDEPEGRLLIESIKSGVPPNIFPLIHK